MKRPFLSQWANRWGSQWRVGANGRYYPVGAFTPIRLRQYRYGRLELVP